MNASSPVFRAGWLLCLLTLAAVGCSSHRSDRATASREDRLTPRRNVITAKDIEAYPQAMSLEQLLVSRVPGLQLYTRNDGTMVLTIMGMANSRTSGEPLYVIDGIPQVKHSGRVGINPHDIEWIEVLKEGGAVAEYGLRGAHGVIVIQTKRGGAREADTSPPPFPD